MSAEKKGILNLDIATTSGWSFDPTDGDKLEYGAFSISTYHYGEGEILLQFAQNINDLLIMFNPAHVWIEAPFIGNFSKGAGKKGVTQNMNVAKLLLRLTGLAHMYAASKGIPSGNIVEVNNQTVKKHMCGTAHVKKDDMIFECERRGYKPKCDNEADAIGIAHVSHSKICGEELVLVK